jgi:hypothetical protein
VRRGVASWHEGGACPGGRRGEPKDEGVKLGRMSVRGLRPPLLAFFLMTMMLFACASEPVAAPAAPTEMHPDVTVDRLPRGGPPTAHPERRCLLPPSPAVAAGVPEPSRAADGGLIAVANAENVIAGLRPGFRACYNRGLANDPTMDGCVTLRVHIAPEGSVGTTDAVVKDGLSPSVVGCLEELLRRAAFDPPGGSGATINVPITFIPRGGGASPQP